MWAYEKKLQYPVKIRRPNAKLAQIIASQYGGPDGELGASLRYLSQRFSMPGLCHGQRHGGPSQQRQGAATAMVTAPC